MEEKIAETAQARHAGFNASVSHRVLAQGEQLFRVIDPPSHTVLVGCDTEHGPKLSNEVELRHPSFPRRELDRLRL